jgi:hypothetical protein
LLLNTFESVVDGDCSIRGGARKRPIGEQMEACEICWDREASWELDLELRGFIYLRVILQAEKKL